MDRTSIIKRHNLTDVMADALIYDVNPADGTIQPRVVGTTVALIDRGICTTRIYGLYGYAYHLTDHGARVRLELRQEAGLTERIPMKANLRQVWRDVATIAKAEKLSQTMISDIMYGRRTFAANPQRDDSPITCDKRIRTALVARGILHPTKSTLTPKGLDLVREINGRKAETAPDREGEYKTPAQRTAEAETVEALEAVDATAPYAAGDTVTAPGRPDLGTGEVLSWRMNEFGQMLLIKWEGDCNPTETQADKVERDTRPVITIDLEPAEREPYEIYARWAVGRPMTREEWQAKGDKIQADAAARKLSTNPYEWGMDMDAIRASVIPSDDVAIRNPGLSSVAMSRRVEQLEAENAELTRKLEVMTAQRDAMRRAINLIGRQHDERQNLAQSIAHYLGQDWTYGVNLTTGTYENTAVPKARMGAVMRFAETGEINAAAMLEELRDEMRHMGRAVTSGSHAWGERVGENIAWLGWLHTWVMDQGGISTSTGFARRDRGPQDGWNPEPVYSMEPSDETELPAWADLTDTDEIACSARTGTDVYVQHGREWAEDEICGDEVTREEYYAHGEESMCGVHAAQRQAAEDAPYLG
jgi:hypothetical protein